MKLRELMTPDVITIGRDASLKEAARRMIEADVSGLPVTTDSGALVGIITEADIVKKEADRRPTRRTGLRQWFTREEDRAESGRIVGEVMTETVLTLGPDADHATAARLMRKAGIKRIPVVGDDGHLLGLLSRSDLLHAFARPDKDIIDEIVEHLMKEVLWIDPRRVVVSSEDGNVVLSGRLETSSDVNLLVELAGRLDGVVSVVSRLSFEVDNTKVEMAPPPPRDHLRTRLLT
jgi:CBS domain-containing protein